MQEIEVRIHWLSITVFTDIENICEFWNKYLEKDLGMLDDTGGGWRGFRHRMDGLAGSKICYFPIRNSSKKEYVHLIFPGSACDSLDPETIRDTYNFLSRTLDTNVTRLDVAFDHVPFEPDDIFQALSNGDVRSLAKRDSIEIIDEPYMPQKRGVKIGCKTVYFGSRSSGRFLRVYNQRGFTRLEIEYKKERANAICKNVLVHLTEYWPELMIEHLLDFVDLVENGKGERLEFWESFIQGRKRAGLKISDARNVDLNKTLERIESQVSAGLSVVNDVLGEKTIDAIIEEGRRKRGKRYISLLDTDISEMGGDR